jgi:hypothetical protein
VILAYVALTLVLYLAVGHGGLVSPWDIPLVTNAPLWAIHGGK